jgi:hypothetical protein
VESKHHAQSNKKKNRKRQRKESGIREGREGVAQRKSGKREKKRKERRAREVNMNDYGTHIRVVSVLLCVSALPIAAAPSFPMWL